MTTHKHLLATARPVQAHLSGYLLVQAESIDDAKKLLQGNPVLNAGGMLEYAVVSAG
jgi:hypothetical protein